MSDVYRQVSLQDVLDLDPESTLILSVNNRHARRIVTELTRRLVAASRPVMAIPDIVPLGAWLTQLADHLSFHESHDMPAHMADEFGAVYLWRQVIEQSEPDHALLNVEQAARLASDADRLLDEWRIRVQPEEETPDFQRFMTWRKGYRTQLRDLDIEDVNLAHERVCVALVDGRVRPPAQHIVLAGFNEISPRLSVLLDALAGQGVDLARLDVSSEPARHVERIQVHDPYEEWWLAAQWARNQLEQHPDRRYAIVAPRLEGSVPLAHRVLDRTLTDRGLAYNIAVGRPLADWPLVRAALAWLHVLACYDRGKPCLAAELGKALLAGHCAGETTEASRRARLDARLRRKGVIEWSAAQFSSALNEWTPGLALAWEQCLTLVQTWTRRDSPAAWAQRVRDFLQTLGFPGDAPLDSHAYQALEALDELFDRLARQTPVTGRIGLGEVLGLLSKMARDTVFQPQRDPTARLDVLGFLESEGGRWDGVWVLGLTDDVLPAVPQPNPLIPLPALRRANAPRATPERELQWAQTIYRSLLACAPEIRLSHPLQEGERMLRPSPCIADLPMRDGEPVHDALPVWPLEYVVDDQGPPLAAGDPVGGGMGLMEAQARNPLWAFAQYRLGASALPDYAQLLEQSLRGQYLHRALDLLWSLVPNQHGLAELAQADRLDDMIGQVARQAADELLGDMGPVLRGLEIERTRTVLRRWLELEMQRDPFDVEAVERREHWTYGSLQLQMRLDRIDRLHDGRLAVIDYKSGANTADPRHSWTRERPVDLQLPLYAAVLQERRQDDDVAALVLANVHSRKTAATGISDGDAGFPGVKHFTSWSDFEGLSWEQVLGRWQASIEQIAEEYCRGHAANAVANSRDLIFCDVLPFLRLTEEYPDDDPTAQ